MEFSEEEAALGSEEDAVKPCQSSPSPSSPETLVEQIENLKFDEEEKQRDEEKSEGEFLDRESKICDEVNEKSEGFRYPLRPGEPDCAYFLRTGLCGYGSNCKFNHPTTRNSLAQVSFVLFGFYFLRFRVFYLMFSFSFCVFLFIIPGNYVGSFRDDPGQRNLSACLNSLTNELKYLGVFPYLFKINFFSSLALRIVNSGLLFKYVL